MEFTGVLVHIAYLWSQTRYCIHFCLRDDNNKFFWFHHMFSAASTRLSWTTSFPAHIRSTEITHVNVMAPGFMWVLGFKLRFSCLHRRCFSHWTVSQPHIKIILSLRLFRIQQIQGSWILWSSHLSSESQGQNCTWEDLFPGAKKKRHQWGEHQQKTIWTNNPCGVTFLPSLTFQVSSPHLSALLKPLNLVTF